MVTKTLTQLNVQMAKILDDFDSGATTSVDITNVTGGSVVAKLVTAANYAAKIAQSGAEVTTELAQSSLVYSSTNRAGNLYRLTKTVHAANAIVDGYQKASFFHACGVAIGITFKAKQSGSAGDSLTVQVINPGSDGALSVVQTGNALAITLAYATGAPTSTIATVIAAVTGLSGCLVDAVATGSTATLVPALVVTPLAGGTLGIASLFQDVGAGIGITYRAEMTGSAGNSITGAGNNKN